MSPKSWEHCPWSNQRIHRNMEQKHCKYYILDFWIPKSILVCRCWKAYHPSVHILVFFGNDESSLNNDSNHRCSQLPVWPCGCVQQRASNQGGALWERRSLLLSCLLVPRMWTLLQATSGHTKGASLGIRSFADVQWRWSMFRWTDSGRQ